MHKSVLLKSTSTQDASTDAITFTSSDACLQTEEPSMIEEAKAIKDQAS